MAYTRKTQRTFYILFVFFALLLLLSVACDNGDGTELTVDRFIEDNSAMMSEIVDFGNDGNIAPFAGGHGDGLCKTTGKNCD